ncbi:MAG: hypothetical protein NTV01_01945, partial [Bacteroidia bacterium]|nr:hypothetical protein [Bacteroidia bacterium]
YKMKIRKLKSLYFIPLLCLLSLVNGCKKVDEGLSSVIWRINFDLVTTTWDIQFIDAATGLPIGGADSEERVQVTLSGDDQRNIVDLAGVRQPIFYSSKGALSLALHPDRLSPQPLTPVRFVIHSSHAYYLPVNVQVLTYEEGIIPIKIYLISRENAPVNVDLLTQTGVGPLVEGKLKDSLKITSPANMASLNMSAGTEVLAANGAPLAGTLNFTFSYWEGGTVNGLKTLPGGQINADSAGTPGLVYLACGIYAEIQDQAGIYAGSVSQPIGCTALINGTVINPATKTKLTPGEEVPVWFMNPGSGVWENKGTTILQASQNKLSANFNLESPGMYMIGWISQNLCSSPLLLHPKTPAEYKELPYAFTMNIYDVYQDELKFLRSVEISGQVTGNYNLRFLPVNSELVFRFEPYTGEDKPYYKIPNPISLTGYCEAGSPVDFDLLPTANSTLKRIEVNFIDVEHNNIRYTPKVFPGYYRKSGTTTWQSTFVYHGQAFIVNPQEGALYQMGVNFKGKFYLKEVTVGTEEVVLVEIAMD